MRKSMSTLLILVIVTLGLMYVEAAGYGSGSADINTGSSQGGNVDIAGLAISSDVQVNSEVKVTSDTGTTFVTLENGDEFMVKISSDQARKSAESDLKVDDCSNCDVELAESDNRAVYKVKTTKEARVFGLFRTNMDISADVDVETGQVIDTDKPWWAFLASESSVSADH